MVDKKAYDREYHAKWRAEHLEESRLHCRINSTKTKDKNRTWLLENYEVKCVVCGFNKSFIAIDGHHLNPEEKIDKMDSLGTWLKLSHKKFQEKVQTVNFVFLCKNCHSMLHAGEVAL